MGNNISRLTVFFEDPFWVGLYEREFDGKYEVCKITFGAEPRDCEIFEFMLKNQSKLKFSPSVEAGSNIEKRTNPKRMQRIVQKQLKNTGIGTKAQQALKLQHEQGKQTRKIQTRQQREAEKEHQFALRQAKHKKKHRGH